MLQIVCCVMYERSWKFRKILFIIFFSDVANKHEFLWTKIENFLNPEGLTCPKYSKYSGSILQIWWKLVDVFFCNVADRLTDGQTDKLASWDQNIAFAVRRRQWHFQLPLSQERHYYTWCFGLLFAPLWTKSTPQRRWMYTHSFIL